MKKKHTLVFPDYEDADTERVSSMANAIRRLGGEVDYVVAEEEDNEATIGYTATDEVHEKIVSAANATGLGWSAR